MLTCPILILRSPSPTLQPPPPTPLWLSLARAFPMPASSLPHPQTILGVVREGPHPRQLLVLLLQLALQLPQVLLNVAMPFLSLRAGTGQRSRCPPSRSGHLFPASWGQVVSGDRGLRGQWSLALPLPPWSRTALKLPGAALQDTGNSPHTLGKTPPEGMSCLQRNWSALKCMDSSQAAWAQILAPSLPSCVTLGQLLNLYVPQFPQLHNVGNNSSDAYHLQGLNETTNASHGYDLCDQPAQTVSPVLFMISRDGDTLVSADEVVQTTPHLTGQPSS